MLIDDIKNIKSGKKELRNFGIIFTVVLGILGGLMLWRKNPDFYILFILSGSFLLAGLLVPVILIPLQKVWMSIALVIGWVMSRVLLTVLFVIIITPLGVIKRLVKGDFLNKKLQKDTASYWLDHEQKEVNEKVYENQF